MHRILISNTGPMIPSIVKVPVYVDNPRREHEQQFAGEEGGVLTMADSITGSCLNVVLHMTLVM